MIHIQLRIVLESSKNVRRTVELPGVVSNPKHIKGEIMRLADNCYQQLGLEEENAAPPDSVVEA